MKHILYLALFVMPFFCTAQCPVKGDNKQPKMQHLDSLKNQCDTTEFFQDIDAVRFSVDDFNKHDPSGIINGQHVLLTGYIVGLKYGGPETCNCHSQDKQDLDYHIEVASTPNETDRKKIQVCEVNRFCRILTYAEIKALIGHRVQIEGRLFFDEEHKQNAVNTNPKGTNLWRNTCWEVHPVFSIKPLD